MSHFTQNTAVTPYWKRVLFSDVLVNKSVAGRIACMGVVAALCIVTNMFEIKFASVQFSLTVFSSVLAGIIIGPLFGFCAVFLGDAVGYLYNSMGYPYYWWVALSVAASAFVSGLIMGLPFRFKGAVYVKLALISILTLLVCSVGINTTGMYYIGLNIYFPNNVKQAIAEKFGGEFSFWIYCAIRYFILGQIYNNIVNYVLLFAVVPLLNAVKPFKLRIK